MTSRIPPPQLHTPSLPTYELVSQQKCDNGLMPLAVRAFTTQAFTWKGWAYQKDLMSCRRLRAPYSRLTLNGWSLTPQDMIYTL